jgi:hypothetical protein
MRPRGTALLTTLVIISALISITAGTTLAGVTYTATHAEPAPSYRWPHRLVCVEDNTNSDVWRVRDAVALVAELPRVRPVWSRDCSGYPQTIAVYEGWWDHDPRYGVMAPTVRGACLTGATVRLNNTHRQRQTPTELLAVAVHEIMHAYGVPHAHRHASVMNRTAGQVAARPTAYDRRVMEALYRPPGCDGR